MPRSDFYYLMDFNRVFALAGAKSGILGEMETFAALLNASRKTEMELHRKIRAAFGIPTYKLTKTHKGVIMSAYTDFLLRTSYEGG